MKHRDVIGLLRSKNKCLQKFLEITLAFLESAQTGDFTGLETFQVQRESCLKAMDLYDRKITELVSTLSDLERTTELSQQVELLLNEKHNLVATVFKTDEILIELIAAEKEKIQRDLAQNQKSKDAIGKFKSSWVPSSGDALDENL